MVKVRAKSPEVRPARRSAASIAVLVVFAGCGGGSEGETPAPTDSGTPITTDGHTDSTADVNPPSDTGPIEDSPDIICSAGAGCCSEDLHCDDGIACTEDRCVASQCERTAKDALCNDNDACTGSETCDPATGCVAGVPLACDDAKPCNGTETCDKTSGCQPGTPPAGCCSAADDCANTNPCDGVETCDASQTCAPGTPLACDDGNPCNGGETCTAGLGCESGVPPACDDQNPCNGAETCDPTSGCLPGIPLACDDGKPCNGVETCDAVSGCEGGVPPPGCCATAGDCDNADPCDGVEICDATKTCGSGSALVCGDGNLCNGSETCAPGVGCQSGAVLPCDDQNTCNGVETCDPGLGCAPGTPPICDDGKPCNGAETCHPIDGCQSGTAVSGCCANDGDCIDLTVCNGTESCDATHTCLPGTTLVCGDDNACNGTETCSATLGCVPGAAPSCDDQNVCNGIETCDPASGCVPGAPLVCADADACNGLETCATGIGCQAGLPPVCDDKDACNGLETCLSPAGCTSGPPPECDDQKPCNGTESCAPATGCTQGVPPVGCCTGSADCDDFNACTGVETCNAATKTCTLAAPLVCDNNDACDGLETCQPTTGCEAGEALDCEDGNACNGTETCLPASGCKPGSDLHCDDGDACTADVCDFLLNPVTGCHNPILLEAPSVTVTGITHGDTVGHAIAPLIAISGAPFRAADIRLDGVAYTSGTTIGASGHHTLEVSVTSCKGLIQKAIYAFTIDLTPPQLSFTLSPAPNEAGWNNSPVTVTWLAKDDLSEIAVLSQPITVSTQGKDIEVTGSAVDSAGHFVQATVSLNLDFKPPAVVILEPGPNLVQNDQYVTSAAALSLNGTFGDDALSGFAGGRATSSKIKLDSQFPAAGAWSVELDLVLGVNTFVVSASDVAGNTGTASLCIIRDGDAPQIRIQAPVTGTKTTAATIDVVGLANDLVVGSITGEDVAVSVNGIAAVVDNGQFIATDVPLDLGETVITATVTDAVGLTATDSVTVTRLDSNVMHLEIISGSGQIAPIRQEVPDPLLVQLVDENGIGVPAHDVVFGVTDNDGTIVSASARLTSPRERAVVVPTDANGFASATLTLGGRAGAGLNRVTVSSQGAVASVSFFASGTPIEGINIHGHAGLNQVGTIGLPLPMPLSVVVTDAGGNPVDDLPVTFEVIAGDGKFGGQTAVTVLSNINGFADVVFTPGVLEGHSTHAVRAFILFPPGSESSTTDGVTFRASAFAPAAPEFTRVRGRVLDEDERPIQGVTLRFPALPEKDRETVTDVDGFFDIVGAPAGFALMEIDGMTAVPPGADWKLPKMTMELHNVAGALNELDRPIYLLRLNAGVHVDGLTDVTIGLDEMPGFELRIPAGTRVTFPDGSHEGLISITQVHFDQAPMAPIDGLQSRLLVTIQPPGVRFDPPAPLQVPNIDAYPPNSKVEMFSYDHDLEAFVSIGIGSVSSDGTVVASDPGVGVVEGGWHCGSNPQGSGGSAGITASLSAGSAEASQVTLNASGGPAKDTHWSWSVVCGKVQVSGPSCAGQGSCTGKATATSGAARGRVKVTHICDDTGESASDEMVVTICDAPSTELSGELTFFEKEFRAITDAAATPLTYLGCNFSKPASEGGAEKPKPGLEIKGSYSLRKTCCPDCPGTIAEEYEGNVSASYGISGECRTPYGFAFKSSVFDFKFGLFGEASLDASLNLGTSITTCCPNPPCFCWKGGITAALSIGLKIYVLSVTVADYNIIDVSGSVSTGVNGQADVTCKQACIGLCWSGVPIEGKISFLNGAIAVSNKYYLFCPRKILGTCYNFDIPPDAPSGGGCLNATDTCGQPGGPQGGPGQTGGGAPFECGSASECTDDAPKCLNNAQCDNGDPCDGKELCDPSFGCVNVGEVPNCSDGINCTSDRCEKNAGCVHEPNNSACPSDNVACTSDYCKADTGCVNEPQDSQCTDGVSCTEDSCGSTGCHNFPIDSQCADSFSCTKDRCDAASGCLHEPENAQCYDGVPCTEDKCETSSGCVYPPRDSECDDGVACTRDKCDAQGCHHEPQDPDCNDNIACTEDTCSASSGCLNTPKDAACDDGVPCTDDRCRADSGCERTPDDAKCDDQDKCDGDETCAPGGCQPGQALQCDDQKPCNGVETCAPGAGCQPGQPPPGCCVANADCNDNNLCNGAETCVNNACQAGQPLQCNDGNPCNGAEKCAPAAGCVAGQAPVCNDGNPCNGVEKCVAGAGCQGGTAPVCDDLNPCNGKESCNPAVGCQGGAPLACDDKNPCNGLEACVAGQGCQTGVALVCDDKNPCNGAESCKAGVGCQTGTPLPCDDGSACNGKETCLAGKGCQPGTALVCDDKDRCTGAETCDPLTGCVAGKPLACDDGVVCNGAETCVPTSGCKAGTPIPACCATDLDCNDADLCTGTETCEIATGHCIDGLPLVCDDGEACTADACLPALGCTHKTLPGCGVFSGCPTCDCAHCGRTWCEAGVVKQATDVGSTCTETSLVCDAATAIQTVCASSTSLATFSCGSDGKCLPEVTPCAAGLICLESPGQDAVCGSCCSAGDCTHEGEKHCEDKDLVSYACIGRQCEKVTHACDDGVSGLYCDGTEVGSYTCAAGECGATPGDDCATAGKVCQLGQCKVGP